MKFAYHALRLYFAAKISVFEVLRCNFFTVAESRIGLKVDARLELGVPPNC